MAKSAEILNKLTDEEFERHRESLIVSLEKKSESIAEELGNLYYLATEEEGDFQYKKKLIAKVKKLKKEEVLTVAREILLNKKTPRLVVMIRSNGNKEPIPKGVLTSVKDFKNRKDRQAKRGVSEGKGS